MSSIYSVVIRKFITSSGKHLSGGWCLYKNLALPIPRHIVCDRKIRSYPPTHSCDPLKKRKYIFPQINKSNLRVLSQVLKEIRQWEWKCYLFVHWNNVFFCLLLRMTTNNNHTPACLSMDLTPWRISDTDNYTIANCKWI